MNKIFKVVWNRTIQSFVVTSELAKGRVKSSAEQNSTDVSAESGKNGIATVFRLTVISAALLGASNVYAANAQVGRIEADSTTSATAISGATATGVGALGVGLTAQANQGNAIAIGNSAKLKLEIPLPSVKMQWQILQLRVVRHQVLLHLVQTRMQPALVRLLLDVHLRFSPKIV